MGSQSRCIVYFREFVITAVDALNDLITDYYRDSKAGIFKLAFSQFEIKVSLVAVEYMSAELVPLSNTQQTKAYDLVKAAKEARTIVNLVAEKRSDEHL